MAVEMASQIAKESSGNEGLKFDEDLNGEERAKLTWLAFPRCKEKGHHFGRINAEILICQHGVNWKNKLRCPKAFESLDDPELDAHIVSMIFLFM